jgi:alanine dehydrogenase
MYHIGIPKEIKEFERRVAIVPNDIKRLFECDTKNITVYVQTGAGYEAGYSDDDYIACGAIILDNIQDIYDKSNIIVKVKEPQSSEYPLITSNHTLLSFFHFAGNKRLINSMVKK